MKVTRFFFDKKAVIDLMDAATRKGMSRAGAFLRKRARSSLRRRKRTSAPGHPPSVHSTDPFATLKNILFFYEPAKRTLVVGPVRLNQTDFLNGIRQQGTVPQLHEFGGVAGIVERSWGGQKWFRHDNRRTLRPGQITRVRTAHYPPRPFMAPALEAELAAGTIPKQWSASVQGGVAA